MTRLQVDRENAHTLTIAVADPPGIRLSVVVADDGTLHLEAYHWYGARAGLEVVSTVGGLPIDTRQPTGRPHPELTLRARL